MSLEESILALTAAVVANTAALSAAPKATKAKKGETESAPTQTATPPTAPAPVAAVSAIVASAPTTPQPTPVDSQLLNETTQAVISLANGYSREKALGILAKRRGSVKCSQLTQEELPGVLAEAQAAIAVERAAKEAETANASLV